MKNKTLFIGLAVYGLGIGTGYAIGMKVLKDRFREDLAEVKDFYAEKIEELGVMPSSFAPEMIDQIIEDDEEAYRETEEYFNQVQKYSTVASEAAGNNMGPRGKGKPIMKYNKPPLVMKDYGKIEDDPNEPDGDEEFDDDIDFDEEYEEQLDAELEARAEEFARRKHENRMNGLPYVIDYNEFMDGPEEYERETLYYYSVDRVLCEDDDSMVEEEEALVGLDYEDVLDMQTTTWVRNDTILKLYTIHRFDASYHETVANAVETPTERDFRIKGRRKEIMDR